MEMLSAQRDTVGFLPLHSVARGLLFDTAHKRVRTRLECFTRTEENVRNVLNSSICRVFGQQLLLRSTSTFHWLRSLPTVIRFFTITFTMRKVLDTSWNNVPNERPGGSPV